MKSVILATIVLASLSASAAYVTVTVCNGGESGQQCNTITYKVRDAVPMAPAADQHLNSEDQVVAPTKYGVPTWLAKLNQALADAGLTAPVQDGSSNGGPN